MMGTWWSRTLFSCWAHIYKNENEVHERKWECDPREALSPEAIHKNRCRENAGRALKFGFILMDSDLSSPSLQHPNRGWLLGRQQMSCTLMGFHQIFTHCLISLPSWLGLPCDDAPQQGIIWVLGLASSAQHLTPSNPVLEFLVHSPRYLSSSSLLLSSLIALPLDQTRDPNPRKNHTHRYYNTFKTKNRLGKSH